MGWFRRRRALALTPADVPFVSPVHAAQVLEPAPAAMAAVWLLLAALALAVVWAASAQVDIVAKGNGRVVAEGREQLIASLEGGILRELLVREGEPVAAGQPLALLDPTRVEAQQAEGQARQLALKATLARLQAEAAGRRPVFGAELPAELVQGESEIYEARRHANEEALETTRRSVGLLQRELAMAEAMSAKGLMSEVEVMRVRRQINDLSLQVQERVNRFRQDASAELVKVRNELNAQEEQMVVRDDALKRTTLVSPVRGFVKQIKANTLGGVVAAGAPVMEIVPTGERVLIEARIAPADIGFIKLGQPVQIKLSAYDYTVYGGLTGVVTMISPDALGDADRAAQPDATWYRTLVRADTAALESAGRSFAVLPGMTGSVEIRTGQRSVLAYLLRPLLKSQEAFRER